MQMRWDQWLMVPGSTNKKKKKNMRKSGKKKKSGKIFDAVNELKSRRSLRFTG